MTVARPLTVFHSRSEWLSQTETWLFNQVRYLPPNVESHIVCESTANLDRFPVDNLHSVGDLSAWRRLALRAYGYRHYGKRIELSVAHRHQVMQHNKAQVLHSHFGFTGWGDCWIAKRLGLKHVVTFYGYDIGFPQQDPQWEKRYRDMFKLVDRVLCEGPFMGQRIIDLGCPPEKMQVHHLGIRIDEIPFKPRTWDGEGPLRILMAASFRQKKGLPNAFEAVGLLQDKVPVEVTVIGDAAPDAEAQAEKQKIMAAVEKHRLGPKVNFMGYQPFDVMTEQAYRHHVFLSPSIHADDGDSEGGAPVSIIEMAASGMMVVSTTHCDIPEVIHHGKSGLLAAEGDVDGLVTHLTWLVDHPERWEGMAQEARRHVEEQFDVHPQGQRLAETYEALVRT